MAKQQNPQPQTDAPLSYQVGNVQKQANGSFTFTEAVDYREPISRVLPKNERYACFLFNSMPVKVAARLFQFVVEEQVPITENLVEKAGRLTVKAALSTSIESYFDYVKTLKPNELSALCKKCDEYMVDWCGDVSLDALVINDGTYKAGQLIRSTSPSLGGQIGIVVAAQVGGPVTLVYSKVGGHYIQDQLRKTDKNVVVSEADLAAKTVADLLNLRADFHASAEKAKEDYNGRQKAKADKKATSDKKQADAKAKRDEKNANKTDEQKANEDPANKRSQTYDLNDEQKRNLRLMHAKVAKMLHPDKHTNSTEEVQKYAGEMMAKANGLKDKNNVWGIQKLLTDVEKFFAPKAAPKAEGKKDDKAGKAGKNEPKAAKGKGKPAATTPPTTEEPKAPVAEQAPLDFGQEAKAE